MSHPPGRGAGGWALNVCLSRLWRETGSGAQAAADEIRPILAEIVRRLDSRGPSAD